MSDPSQPDIDHDVISQTATPATEELGADRPEATTPVTTPAEGAPATSASDHTPPSEQASGWQAFATLGEFLREDGWYPQQMEDRSIYRVYFSGRNGDLRCYAQIRTDLDQFLFYVIAPVKAPLPMRAAVAEYITRANFGLRIGNFEMDYSDGEIRYKSSLDFEHAALTPVLIRNTIYPAVHTMDLYLPGLLSVLYGNKAPDAAIAEIED